MNVSQKRTHASLYTEHIELPVNFEVAKKTCLDARTPPCNTTLQPQARPLNKTPPSEIDLQLAHPLPLSRTTSGVHAAPIVPSPVVKTPKAVSSPFSKTSSHTLLPDTSILHTPNDGIRMETVKHDQAVRERALIWCNRRRGFILDTHCSVRRILLCDFDATESTHINYNT